jgi:hypothetical protein
VAVSDFLWRVALIRRLTALVGGGGVGAVFLLTMDPAAVQVNAHCFHWRQLNYYI